MPGSGLGLSIVRQAAERHGGWVTAANRDPHGAIFTVWLPGHVDDAESGTSDGEPHPIAVP
jgi:two-component system sensor histidine kinase MprB